MNDINKIVFWQQTPSFHQSSWIRSFAKLVGRSKGKVSCVFEGEMSQERIEMGWLPPDYGETHIISISDDEAVGQILTNSGPETLHVFSAIMSSKMIYRCFKKALRTQALVGLLSEGRDWRGFKGALRQIDASKYEKRYTNRVSFVLAIGSNGMHWFKRCGYLEEQLFPFCYVVEAPPLGNTHLNLNTMDKVKILTIGSLIQRKGYDLLIRGLSQIKPSNWELDMIGEGDQRPLLEKMIKKAGLAEKIKFHGNISNPKVRQIMETADLMVLTSRWDGWGAVINEALMSGVRVVCSDFCGASDLIIPDFNGSVFKRHSEKSFLVALNKWILKGPVSKGEREKIRKWAECINGDSVATYFKKIIDHVAGCDKQRPEAPWLKKK